MESNKIRALHDALSISWDADCAPFVLDILSENGYPAPEKTDPVELTNYVAQLLADAVAASKTEERIKRVVAEYKEEQRGERKTRERKENERQLIVSLIVTARDVLNPDKWVFSGNVRDRLYDLAGGPRWGELGMSYERASNRFYVLQEGERKYISFELWVKLLEAKAEEEYGITIGRFHVKWWAQWEFWAALIIPMVIMVPCGMPFGWPGVTLAVLVSLVLGPLIYGFLVE